MELYLLRDRINGHLTVGLLLRPDQTETGKIMWQVLGLPYPITNDKLDQTYLLLGKMTDRLYPFMDGSGTWVYMGA